MNTKKWLLVSFWLLIVVYVLEITVGLAIPIYNLGMQAVSGLQGVLS